MNPYETSRVAPYRGPIFAGDLRDKLSWRLVVWFGCEVMLLIMLGRFSLEWPLLLARAWVIYDICSLLRKSYLRQKQANATRRSFEETDDVVKADFADEPEPPPIITSPRTYRQGP